MGSCRNAWPICVLLQVGKKHLFLFLKYDIIAGTGNKKYKGTTEVKFYGDEDT